MNVWGGDSPGETNENSITENVPRQETRLSLPIHMTRITRSTIQKSGTVMIGILLNFAQILIFLAHFSHSSMLSWSGHRNQLLRMVFEKMRTTVINVITSKIVICAFVQIFVRTVNTSTDHLNQKIVLMDSMSQNVNIVMSVSVVQIALTPKNVSIVETHVICYFVLIAVDVTIALAVPISEINHIIFSMNHSQKKSTGKE